jgi:hypothetical protein
MKVRGLERALRAGWVGALALAWVLSCAAQAPRVGQAPQAESAPPAVAPITDAVNVLTPPGRFVLEPSFQYSHSTDARVVVTGFTIIPALTVGVIDVRNVERDQFIFGLTGRYGVTSRLEVEARVPWMYRHDSTLARPLDQQTVTESLFTASGEGMGDIEIAARYQLTDRPPFYIGYLRFKSRSGTGPFDTALVTPQAGVTVEQDLATGTGFYALQPGVSVLVPSDPAVFFGGASYIWNIKRDIGSLDPNGVPIGEFDPGDGINFNFGMGLSINDRASFSMGYDHSTFFRNKREGQTVPNAQVQQVGTALFGLSYRLGLRTNMNLTLGIGATDAAPDISLALRFPISF